MRRAVLGRGARRKWLMYEYHKIDYCPAMMLMTATMSEISIPSSITFVKREVTASAIWLMTATLQVYQPQKHPKGLKIFS